MAINGNQMISLEWAMITFTLMFVVTRLYINRPFFLTIRNYMFSDLFFVGGWLSFLTQTALDTRLNIMNYFDESFFKSDHSEDIRTRAFKLVFTEQVLYLNCMYCIKASMLFLYHEFFPRPTRSADMCEEERGIRWLKRALIMTDVLVAISWLNEILIMSLSCSPSWRNWTPNLEERCDIFQDKVFTVLAFAPHLITDLLVYVLPLFLIPFLHLPYTEKLGLALTFAVGFASIFSAGAIFVLSVRFPSPVIYWTFSVAEQTFSILVGSCPALRAVIQALHGRKQLWRAHKLSSNSDQIGQEKELENLPSRGATNGSYHMDPTHAAIHNVHNNTSFKADVRQHAGWTRTLVVNEYMARTSMTNKREDQMLKNERNLVSAMSTPNSRMSSDFKPNGYY